jgi:hypothetical protein
VTDLGRRDRPEDAAQPVLGQRDAGRDQQPENDRAEHDPQEHQVRSQQQHVPTGPPRGEQPEHRDEEEQPRGAEQGAEEELGPDAGQQRLRGQQRDQEDPDARPDPRRPVHAQHQQQRGGQGRLGDQFAHHARDRQDVRRAGEERQHVQDQQTPDRLDPAAAPAFR